MFKSRKKSKGANASRQGSEQRQAKSSNPKDEKRSAAERSGSRQSDRQELSSTLNSHLSFHGDLKFSGTVLVNCDFRGSVVTDDKLVVGKSGRIDAEVSAGIVEISGRVRGNVKAKSGVRILSGGQVYGNIETPTISMEEGVVFEGNCTRSSPQQATEATRVPPPAKAQKAEEDKAPQAQQAIRAIVPSTLP